MIERINCPKDLKKLSVNELEELCADIRKALINKMSVRGGHFGPNLGAVELEVALHYVFDSPNDKFVFDVSHQSYTHKMLTGRKEAFLDPEHYADVSGYTEPKESEHDMFCVGHTSTSISLALGLAKGRDVLHSKENIIAIIGDGSLSGGEAMEGLNIAGELKSNFIIIVNDNQMSIAENHGGLYKNLEILRNTNGKYENNLFKSFNLDYIYLDNGNDISKVIEVFKKIKDIDHPIVVHINTEKGHGYKPSIEHKSDWHYTMPFDIETGKEKAPYIRESYANITGDILKTRIQKGEPILAVVAALPFNIGFSEEDRFNTYKDNFVDVGIAEESAVALISGAAKRGSKAVFATSASFLQRTYDQISQDLALNNNGATILVSGSSVYGGRDATHLGIYAASMLTNIPNLKVLAPTSKAEYISMLNWSLDKVGESVTILIPAQGIVEDSRIPFSNFDKVSNKIEEEGKDIALIGVNDFFKYSEDIAHELKEKGYNPTLINPVCISSLDTNVLDTLKNYKVVATIEGTILDGGYGQKVASYLAKYPVKVLNYGLRKEIIDRFNPIDILKDNHMSKEDIIFDIIKNL